MSSIDILIRSRPAPKPSTLEGSKIPLSKSWEKEKDGMAAKLFFVAGPAVKSVDSCAASCTD